MLNVMSDRTLALRAALAASGERVMDFFKLWDEDKSGEMEKREFLKAIRALGGDEFQASREELSELFDSFDTDKSGAISFKELNKQVRADPIALATLHAHITLQLKLPPTHPLFIIVVCSCGLALIKTSRP